jgi:uncharacterized protein (DUF433 family)
MRAILKRIVIDDDTSPGTPVIRGTRVQVDLILRLMAMGRSMKEIASDYFDLSREDMHDAFMFAAEAVRDRALRMGNGMKARMRQWWGRITFDPEVAADKPVIRGTRVQVDLILRLIAWGRSVREILDDYRELTMDDIRAALWYAAIRVASYGVAGQATGGAAKQFG